MAIPRVLRENAALAIGLALPILVVLLFLVASRGPGMLADPPEHDLLLRAEGARRNELPYRVELVVIGERLRARVFRIEREETNRALVMAAPLPRLFIWEHENRTLREIEVSLPENVESLPDGAEIPLGEVGARRVTTALTAPDGYAYEGFAGGPDAGIFGLFFGRGERRIAIEKDGARVAISLPDGLQYWNVELLGWVLE